MFETIDKFNFWNNPLISSGLKRNFYLDKIVPYIGNRLIKVIVGQRRVGKSCILRMIINHLINELSVNKNNILYINKDLYELEFIKNAAILIDIINEYKKRLKPAGRIYIFLDEIQEISEWEKAVNSLSQDFTTEYELFITGSNSNLLSKELGTYLTGRYINFEIFPFSFSEYSAFYEIKEKKTLFLTYLKDGGLPELQHLKEDELKRNYIESLKDSIILKDIVARYKIRDAAILETLINFLIDSIGSYFSINKIVNFLNSNKIKANNETISNYLKYIEDSFLIHSIEKYDIKGKEILLNEKKFYLNDIGFKYYLNGGINFNASRYLENIVFLYLKRTGFKVTVGRIKDKEIDFIAEKNKEIKYIQVCYLLSDESVIEREFGNLEMIDDNYEKIVLSLDEINFGNRKGIKHIPVWEFID